MPGQPYRDWRCSIVHCSDAGEKLGHHRRVVERELAGPARYQSLSVRYERRADTHETFLCVGCSLVCLNCLP